MLLEPAHIELHELGASWANNQFVGASELDCLIELSGLFHFFLHILRGVYFSKLTLSLSVLQELARSVSFTSLSFFFLTQNGMHKMKKRAHL